MKSIKKYLRTIASILVLLILLQSCTVYRKTPISLNQAIESESEVKVKTIMNAKTFKFNRISEENGNFYGIKKGEDKIVKTPLDSKNILSIREKDRSASTILTIVVIVGSIMAVLIGAFLASGGPDIGLNWEYP